MTKAELENKIATLKMDYIRIQGDMEKLESVGRNVEATERVLIQIEEELKECNQQLAKCPS
ncbi:hypothetical protein J2S13_002498 [Oikeobacillus pervagus]|uniref:Uncharacterized protein n=1 Tax=Oikeobacillus pervagus TaxID=1325931 RepID=A0AAJ1WLD7_9BACI|nr:SE1832 family protein [Oikeobacillus pervagus]MDQ0216076.1 hypothetical protein [Oikeobacillus pervagus]